MKSIAEALDIGTKHLETIDELIDAIHEKRTYLFDLDPTKQYVDYVTETPIENGILLRVHERLGFSEYPLEIDTYMLLKEM